MTKAKAQAKGTVFVAVSGGVDSSVAALLLKQQGYEVKGYTFRFWKQEDPICEFDSLPENLPASIIDAKKICDILGIPHTVIDYREQFERDVIAPFIQDYQEGKTPNPCLYCNQKIKFGDFFRRAKEMGADYIATGHYSQILYDETINRWRLRRAAVQDKDQSYVLYSFSQELLASLLMPLGEYSKDEIRQLAETHGLLTPTSSADSQDICFIPDGDYAGFLHRYSGTTSSFGNFVDNKGNILGQHKGIEHYTIGQRRGLGTSFGKPMFVTKINARDDTVSLGENADLFQTVLEADNLHWIDFDILTEPLKVHARIRYAHQPAPATIIPVEGDRVLVQFDQPQRAITAGQAVVFYDQDFVVGGGIIQ